MEYEIEEEGELLDASNNPSLDRSTKPAFASWNNPKADPHAKPKVQRAIAIPEEADAA